MSLLLLFGGRPRGGGTGGGSVIVPSGAGALLYPDLVAPRPAIDDEPGIAVGVLRLPRRLRLSGTVLATRLDDDDDLLIALLD